MTLDEYKNLSEPERMRAAASALSAVAATQMGFDGPQEPMAYIVECPNSGARGDSGANWIIKTPDGTTLIMKMLAQDSASHPKKQISEA
ncbi:MAG: hypothetical protein LAT78_00830 [Roseinatronobacter sp.]|jgi:hypothetical protein|nr:hypothetical protein [Roseinatronobacter sp.]